MRLALLLFCLLGLAACGTIAGLGSDIASTARWTLRQL